MNTSVLIVGAGPVGLTLACELTRYRIQVRIVDKAPQRADKSKAIVIWSRTLELLDGGDRTERGSSGPTATSQPRRRPRTCHRFLTC